MRKVDSATTGIPLSSETSEALGDMRSQMRSVFRLMKEMDRSSRKFRDEMEPARCQVKDRGEASSVRGRKRAHGTHAAHELRAQRGKHEDDIDSGELLASVQVDQMLDQIFGAPSSTGMPLIVPRGGGGTYLDRRLLGYYLGHMAETTEFLNKISFFQREEFKVDRDYGDMRRRNDLVNREYEEDRQWEQRDSMDRAANALHVENARIADELNRQRDSDRRL